MHTFFLSNYEFKFLTRSANLQSGSKRHRYFVWFFRVPFKAPNRAILFTVIPRNRALELSTAQLDSINYLTDTHSNPHRHNAGVKPSLQPPSTRIGILDNSVRASIQCKRRTNWCKDAMAHSSTEDIYMYIDKTGWFCVSCLVCRGS